MNTRSRTRRSGPRGLPLVGCFPAYSRDRLGFLLNVRASYGDLVFFRLGRQLTCLVSDPDLIEEVLVRRHRDFEQPHLQRVRRLLGQGLIATDGPIHREHRRTLQPPFHSAAVLHHADTMTSCAAVRMAGWQDEEVLDIAHEMSCLTYSIVCETLFGYRPDARETTAAAKALTDFMDWFWRLTVPGIEILDTLPLPSSLRFRRSRAVLRDQADSIVDRWKGPDSSGRGSFLKHVPAKQHAGDLTEEQVRDHVLTVLLAGHETMANALSWTWQLLATSPSVEYELHAELDRVLAGRRPEVQDLPQLSFTRAVVAESLRLRPPVWLFVRRSLKPMQLGDHAVPTGTFVLISPYVVHRMPRFYSNPRKFVPSRWLEGGQGGDDIGGPAAMQWNGKTFPRYAYFPFGGGVRKCIGETFAWTEAVSVIATIGSRWRFRAIDGWTPEPDPKLTLRIRNGLPMRPEKRSGVR